MPTELNQRIQRFYDRSTPLWLEVWGEHMHHGYYGPEGDREKGGREAQVDLMRALLAWGGVGEARRVLDAGCGVGGSARFLASTLGSRVYGVTLSPVQARRARGYNRAAGLEDEVRIDVRDMLTLGPEDGPFDLVWSMESAEHIPDKARLMKTFFEVLRPGGRLLMATWCRRAVPPRLTPPEERLLGRICRWYHIPPLVSVHHLQRLAREAGFQELQIGDWSRAVAPFWSAVIRSALRWDSLAGLLRAGLPTLRGAWAMRYMRQGFKDELIQFAVIQARKS